MKDRLTIVVPVYNREEMVKRTLESIEVQTYRPINVVLVDNNSVDNTFNTLSEWKKSAESEDFKIKIITEAKPGASAARNAGLRCVETEWTMFFDSDDTMPPDHVEKAMNAVDENPDCDIVGWDRKLFFSDGTTVLRKFKTSNMIFENLTQSIFSTQNYMAKTDLFRRAGGWDEQLSNGDDIELGNRLLALKPKAVIAKGATVNVYESADSISHCNQNRIESISEALNKIKELLPLDKRYLVDFQIVNKAATWAKDDLQSKAVVEDILSRQPLLRRIVWRALYLYQLWGGRGAARIYKALHFGTLTI